MKAAKSAHKRAAKTLLGKAAESVLRKAVKKDEANLDKGLTSEPGKQKDEGSKLKEARDAARDQLLHDFRTVYGWSAYVVFMVFCALGVCLIILKLFFLGGLDNVEFAAAMGFFGAVLAIVTGMARGLFGGGN